MPTKARKCSALHSYRRCSRRQPASQETVLSTTQRCRPSRVDDSTPLRAMRWRMRRPRSHFRKWSWSCPLSAWSLAGRRRRGPRRERTGGIPRTSGCRPRLSCTLAPEMPSDSGTPFRSVIRWIFDPGLPRSVGFGPVSGPLLPPGRDGVDRAPRPVQLTPSAELVEDHPVQPGPHPLPAPLSKAPVDRGPGRPEHRR